MINGIMKKRRIGGFGVEKASVGDCLGKRVKLRGQRGYSIVKGRFSLQNKEYSALYTHT